MTLSRKIALGVWLIALVWSVVAAPPITPGAQEFALAYSAALPVCVFASAAFVTSRYPFEFDRIRSFVDANFGEGAYRRFIFELKPLLLFGVSGILAAVAQTARAGLWASPAAQAFGLSQSLELGGGVAFLLSGFILARRGLSWESYSSWHPWRYRVRWPAFKPRLWTAAAAGIITASGLSFTHALSSSLGLGKNSESVVNLFAAAAFFLLPVAFLVVGPESFITKADDFTDARIKKSLAVIPRGLIWFLFLGLTWVVIADVRGAPSQGFPAH